MASGINMTGPVCLVENTKGQLSVGGEALEILSGITQPVVVVAIVGLYRTGKSYLMNKLAGKKKGFPLGSTVRSETKGIWMWCVPHPSKPDHTLVLLDTEGLGDVEKGDPMNDSWIFALAVLLCSTLVYNSMNTINNQALEQLHYVTELTELIRAESRLEPDDMDNATEFVSFFPDFVWAVRDFTLALELDGHPVTEDVYLENALKLIPGDNPHIQSSNKTRECIRCFFPRRKCFVFNWPTNDRNLLHHMEDIQEDQLDCDFQKQSKNFCSYVFTHARTKKLREGIVVTGNRLGTLVVTYVDAINSGAVPCLENAVTTLAQRENAAAVQRAADHYSQQMAQRARLPTDTLQELLDAHAACEREALAVFMEHSFKDKHQEFQKKLLELMEEKKEDFLQQNEEASEKYCKAELERLSEPLRKSVLRGTFFVPKGHELYLEARERIEWDYELLPRKGIKANEVLQSFLQQQVVTEESILQADKALTTGEKAIAEERAKKEEAEKEVLVQRQKQEELEQKRQAQERNYAEHIAQLEKKIKKEKKDCKRDYEKMLEQQLKVQQYLLMEGHKKKSEEKTKVIEQLKEKTQPSKNENMFPGVIDKALQRFIQYLVMRGIHKGWDHLKSSFN
ncbi:guanylate-binding protein 7-like [Nycticebus coucang]|uniref:guanylate-binding protein 7-like n=1 Tax=Nycticebus coucang TaxID=9470 RepID=UPI00234DAD8A|nr:guanylate-binding protein 7-like [Nycticebus coucang]